MLERLLQVVGFGLCHQLPERSFSGGGFQVPVCSRDTGIYVGFAIASLLLVVLGRTRRPSEVPPWYVAVISGAFVAAMGWDGITSYAGFRPTTNDIRLMTGLLAGFAIAAYTVPLAAGTLLRHPGHDRVLGRPAEVLAWLAGVPLSFGLVRWALPLTGVAYPILVAVCVLFTLTSVNLIIVGVFRPFDRSVRGLKDLWLPGAIAFVLTLVEVLGSAALRLLLLGGG